MHTRNGAQQAPTSLLEESDLSDHPFVTIDLNDEALQTTQTTLPDNQIELEKQLAILLAIKYRESIEKLFSAFAVVTHDYTIRGRIETSITEVCEFKIQLMSIKLNLDNMDELQTSRNLKKLHTEFLSLEENLFSTLTKENGLFFDESYSIPMRGTNQYKSTEDEWLLLGHYKPLLLEAYYLIREICVKLTRVIESNLINEIITALRMDIQNTRKIFEEKIISQKSGWVFHAVLLELDKKRVSANHAYMMLLSNEYIHHAGICNYLHYTIATPRSSECFLFHQEELNNAKSTVCYFYYCLARHSTFEEIPENTTEHIYRSFVFGIYHHCLANLPDRGMFISKYSQEEKQAITCVLLDMMGLFPYLFQQTCDSKFKNQFRNFNLVKTLDMLHRDVNVSSIGMYGRQAQQISVDQVKSNCVSGAKIMSKFGSWR